MYYTITKELLTENKKVFKFLHESNGFDFEKEFFIAKHEGRFTYNAVKKEIAESITGDYTAALILRPSKEHYFNNKLYYVNLDQQAGKFAPLREQNLNYWDYDTDYFFGIGDFEEVRKHKTSHIYIIAQKNEYLKPAKKTSGLNYSQRFRYVPSKWGETCSDGNGNTWINKITLMLLDGSAKKVEYNTNARYDKTRPASVSAVIDKSGYLLLERRRDLKRRAAALRAEREKAAALAADFSEKENAIKTGINNAKMHIAEMALSVETVDDAQALDKAADKFRWLIFYFNRYTENAAKKAFSSIAAIERNLNELQMKINEVMGEM